MANSEYNLYIRTGVGRAQIYSAKEIFEIYKASKILRAIANQFQLETRSVRRLLDLAKVDYLRDFQDEHTAGNTWSQIAERHGMKSRTLTKLMKEKGYPVKRGRRHKYIAPEEISAAVKQEPSTNAIASRLAIHWETAQKLYDQELSALKNS